MRAVERDDGDEELACRRLARAYGYTVRSLSLASRSPVRDWPDLYLQHAGRGVRLWWEVKHGRDKLTRGQHAFLLSDLIAGGVAGCGDRHALKTVLDILARAVSIPLALRRCGELVDLLAAEGFRGEKKARKARQPRTPR